jgi:Ribonucleotide reductase, barrel domain
VIVIIAWKGPSCSKCALSSAQMCTMASYASCAACARWRLMCCMRTVAASRCLCRCSCSRQHASYHFTVCHCCCCELPPCYLQQQYRVAYIRTYTSHITYTVCNYAVVHTLQGLADAFILMRLPFESEGARTLNREIFETMYHAALSASVDLAQEEGTYDSYAGSPLSKGQLQFDLWGGGSEPLDNSRWDWGSLRERVKQHGVRNSLLLAPMPTASTAQILVSAACCHSLAHMCLAVCVLFR